MAGPTIQVDLPTPPQRFDVTGVAADGQERQVFMVHRAVLGSLERSMDALIETTQVRFLCGWLRCKLWLFPLPTVT